jgi:bisphosphoglycerate-dependent phosphoglycerate mutase
MSELQTIESALEQAARRQRWSLALRGMWFGLLVGSLISLLVAGIFHVYPIPAWSQLAAPLFPLPCMAVGFVIGGWRKQRLAQVARWLDGRQHLQERLSTALEVASKPEDSTWRGLVMADAAKHVQDIDARRLMPIGLPKATRWALVVLALCVGLGFVPEYRSKAYVQTKKDKEVIKEVGKQLAELTRRNLEKRPPALETTQKSMESVSDLGDQLAKKTLTRSEALKDLANVADKLKEQIGEMGKDPAMKRLEQAARNGSSSDSQTPEGLQKQIDSMQKQMGTPTGTPEAMEKLERQLQKLQEAAKGMAGNNSPSNTEAERQKLSEALSALSKQTQEMGLQLPQLDEAIAALASNQPDLLMRDLQASLNDLEKMRDMAKSLQQLQQQMDKMGKDLAEQLKNGQPEAAQMTLNKMVDQLRSASLSQEQMQKMLGDVSKAIDPAGNYGKVAEHLKAAASKMQSGDKPGSAQSLAEASKELGKLMEQMGDAQALMAELDALKKASMCVGTCQGWGMCKGTGYSMKPGGKPGSGVGTWADEKSGWMYDGQWSDHWDNTGSVRPDQDPRGLTDRGDSGLNDALKPTKVKGQFSPGGQMPSITLKGVSIKGQSKVAFEEAATAAQSDAQSALSQEKVPRAYQGAVKDYFDDFHDLKK